MSNVFFKSTRFVFLGLAVAFFTTTASLAAGENPCDRPELAEAPHIQQFTQEFCAMTARVLDPQSGLGNGQFPVELRRLLAETTARLQAIPQKEWTRTGITPALIGQLVRDMNGGKRIPVPVVQFRSVIEETERRLQAATDQQGAEMFELFQAPVAALNEALYVYLDRFSKEVITLEDLKALSDMVYPNLNTGVIQLPVEEKYIVEANKKLKSLKINTYRFQRAPEIETAEDVPLLHKADPLPKHRAVNKALRGIRYALNPFFAYYGTARAAGFSVAGKVAGAWNAFLEWQFNALSNTVWAPVWAHKLGTLWNVMVNYGYPTLNIAIQLAVTLGMGQVFHMDVWDFTVKTLIVGTPLFIATFGGLQIAFSRMINKGILTEGGRYLREFIPGLSLITARAVALGAANSGMEDEAFKLWDVTFNNAEKMALEVHIAFLAALTIPTLVKLQWGDGVFDQVTQFDAFGKYDPAHPWNQGLLGKARELCARGVAAFSNFYTPRRLSRRLSRRLAGDADGNLVPVAGVVPAE